MNHQAVIFDLDGVIVDCHGIAQELHVEAANRLGARLTLNEMKSLGSLSSRQFWSLIKKRYNLPQDVDLLIRQYDGEEEIKSYSRVGPIDGIVPLIKSLHDLGIAMALATSGRHYRLSAAVDIFGLKPYFTVLVCDEDVSASKPDPEIFLLAARKLAVPPANCIVIEDSRNGVQAALRAGMKCVAYSGSPHVHEDLTGAHLIIDDFRKLTPEILSALC